MRRSDGACPGRTTREVNTYPLHPKVVEFHLGNFVQDVQWVGPALLTDPRPQPRRPYRSPALQAPRKQQKGNYIRTLRHLEKAEVAEEDRREQRDGRRATDSREHVLDGAKSIYGAVDSVATLKGRLEI